MAAGSRATYRLQLRREFDFAAATALLPHLRELGVTHVYLSPCFQAAPGSTHGYDVVDPSRISDELGGELRFNALCAAAQELELAILLDTVPNHMCVSAPRNRRWWDVLEDGRQSPWAETFDIDWEAGAGRVLLPVLGDQLERVVERGELRLGWEPEGVVVRYFDNRAPISLTSLRETLQQLAGEQSSLGDLAGLIEGLPPAHDHTTRMARLQARALAHEALTRLVRDDQVAPSLSVALNAIAAEPQRLLHLLNAQHHLLAFWREAATHINYRRFFDINSLAGVRVEEARVFEDTQALPIELVQRGLVQGLRIDHVDGLRQPREYLGRLRERAGDEAWLVVEKILDQGERLPQDWPVAGTTGYEFGAVAGGLFVDPAGRGPLQALAAAGWSGAAEPRHVIEDAKRLVCERSFGADITRAADRLLSACSERVDLDDVALEQCRSAVTAVLVGMPVYRTYSAADGSTLSGQYRSALDIALRHASAAEPGLERLIGLIGELIDGGARTAHERDLVLRLQQTSAAVTAKGVEDTAFYRCVALSSLDEVGDSPLHWGTSLDGFHAHNLGVAERWPETLLATSTHDTKRSADVRMRLHVLSEFPQQWAEQVQRWGERNARHQVDGAPDGLDELLLYQTLVGAHPLDPDRAAAYMEKATREAKRRTSWTDPDPGYAAAVDHFTRTVVADPEFNAELAAFLPPLVTLGRVNALALTLLQLTAPGVPDLYQGGELWDLSLVDPDNRRPVDHALRRRLLDEHATGDMPEWDEPCGAAKLALISRALALRNRRGACFAPGAQYRPLRAAGSAADHVVAFQRGDSVLTVVPRLAGGLSGWSSAYEPAWRDTVLSLPDGVWQDTFTDAEHSRSVPIDSLLGPFPVALLELRP